MESIVTCFVAGSSRTRIIDWVNGDAFFPSSSDPSSSTVNGAPGAADGGGVAFTPGLLLGDTVTVWLVCPTPATTTGKKYAAAPANPESIRQNRVMATSRTGCKRDARRRLAGACPAISSYESCGIQDWNLMRATHDLA